MTCARPIPYWFTISWTSKCRVGKSVGDCYDRYLVRMEEMRRARVSCAQCLDRLPGGRNKSGESDQYFRRQDRVAVEKQSAHLDEELIHQFMLVTEGVNAPPGEIYFGAENPKGDWASIINSRGGGTPHGLKIRAPSSQNLSVRRRYYRGHMMSDVSASWID